MIESQCFLYIAVPGSRQLDDLPVLNDKPQDQARCCSVNLN